MRRVQHAAGHRWTSTSVVDDEAIDHERVLAQVPVVGEDIEVRVAQRVDFDLLADPVVRWVQPARITLGRIFELTPDQARELGRCLNAAAHCAEDASSDGRPRLVAGG